MLEEREAMHPEGPEWKNSAYEVKRKKGEERSYGFAHPAQGFTNTHPYFNHREGPEHEKQTGA